MNLFLSTIYLLQFGSVIGSTCGTVRDTLDSKKIVGGTSTNSEFYPWYVAFMEIDRASKNYSVYCGGSLITKRHSLTGAHCYFPSELSHIPMEKRFAVYINTKNICLPEPDGVKVEVLSVELHQGWMSTELPQNDIALITFKYLVSYATPLCLPSKRLYDWETGIIIGFGSQWVKGKYPCAMKIARITIYPQEKCRSSVIGSIIAPHTICAGIEQGGVDACDGDSGGPLMVVVDGRYEFVGIVSYGKGCGRKNHPGIYTDLSDPVHYKWIMDRIHKTEMLPVLHFNHIAITQSDLEGSSSFSAILP